MDSHSVCSYGCYYCFSDNLIQHREGRSRPIGQTSLRSIEALFAGEPGTTRSVWQKALKYDRRNENGYPCAVQLGAINDPCDHIERNQGWLLKLIDLAIKYNQPVRMSTKGTVLSVPEYLRALGKAPHLFWVAFSIISPDDELLEKVDRRAPNATARLATMKALSDIGVSTSLRFRPIFPGISDATPSYPEAYRVLIEKATEAGAKAISYEVGFVPGAQDDNTKWRWRRMSNILGVPFTDLYRSFGPTTACMRPPASWTENIMHAIYEVSHKNGLVVGVSDPVWKQLTDTGCCCGILPDDPVFGNWEEESATNQLLLLKRGEKEEISAEDIVPPWAYDHQLPGIVNPGAGPLVAWDVRHLHWSDKLKEVWENVDSERGPLRYFQGALLPTRRDEDGNLWYRYEGLKRTYPAVEETPYFSVPPGKGEDTTPLLEYRND